MSNKNNSLRDNNSFSDNENNLKKIKYEITIINNNFQFSNNSTIIYNIIKFLNIDDIHSCSLINKQWNKVTNNNKIWELLFLKNIFQINDFVNEDEIYSKGCIKQQFSEKTFKFKDLFRIFFPDQFNRFKYTNIFKNLEIISNDNQNILPNIDSFEYNLITLNKSLYDSNDTNVPIDDNIFIDYYLKELLQYSKNFKSSLNNFSESFTKSILLLSSNQFQKSKNFHYKPIFYKSIKYLICVPEEVESINGSGKRVLEFSRFICATFDIVSKYDCVQYFVGSAGYKGALLDTCNHQFQLFDINNPSFDKNNNLELKEYIEDNSLELKKYKDLNKIPTTDLWHIFFNQNNSSTVPITGRYIEGLNEFSRNKFDFGNKEFYKSLKELKIDYLFPNIEELDSFEKEKIKQINNIEWKLKLYSNYRNNLSNFKENDKIGLKHFIENSKILKFNKSNKIGSYQPMVQTEFNFHFSIPYGVSVLYISINYYNCSSSIEEYYKETYPSLSIQYKFNSQQQFKYLYNCVYDENQEGAFFDIFIKKSEHLLFQDFISLLFSKKFPKLQFKLSSLFLLIELNKIISSEETGIEPKLSNYDDYY